MADRGMLQSPPVVLILLVDGNSRALESDFHETVFPLIQSIRGAYDQSQVRFIALHLL